MIAVYQIAEPGVSVRAGQFKCGVVLEQPMVNGIESLGVRSGGFPIRGLMTSRRWIETTQPAAMAICERWPWRRVIEADRIDGDIGKRFVEIGRTRSTEPNFLAAIVEAACVGAIERDAGW